MSVRDVLPVQMVKKEMALAIALAQKRFPEGSATGDRRHEAEREYADAMSKVGGATNDAAVMAMAAEAYMNLSPWDYYEVLYSGMCDDHSGMEGWP